MHSETKQTAAILSVPVLVAALGYFVDIYDLLLFGIIRVPSLKDMGLDDASVLSVVEKVISYQM